MRNTIEGERNKYQSLSNSNPIAHPKGNSSVDKKAKKRLDVINKKLQTLRVQLAGSKAQADDLAELKQFEDDIAKLEAEAKELKSS
ncbi:hypothetical protein N9D23_08805 [Rubripirellula sp.]|jgi:hypothetical protein|nr:hypothetical protein [Rubripirellula sp.]